MSTAKAPTNKSYHISFRLKADAPEMTDAEKKKKGYAVRKKALDDALKKLGIARAHIATSAWECKSKKSAAELFADLVKHIDTKIDLLYVAQVSSTNAKGT